MHPMNSDDMELEELAQLKELAKEGMAKEFRGDMGPKDEAPAEGGDIEPVPGAEDAEDVEPDGDEGGGLDPALLAKVLAAMGGG